jgi:hypothetical protein
LFVVFFILAVLGFELVLPRQAFYHLSDVPSLYNGFDCFMFLYSGYCKDKGNTHLEQKILYKILFGVKAVLGCHKNKERNPKICVANFFH